MSWMAGRIDEKVGRWVSGWVGGRDAPVLNHGGSFEREAPGNHPDVFGKAHGTQHFRSEHPAVAYLRPPVFLGGGWVGGWLKRWRRTRRLE